MKQILLIGGNSFLASYLIKDWEGKYNLTICSRKRSSKVYNFIEFDFPKKLIDLSILSKFDIIVYSVAAGVQSSINYNSEEIFYLNSYLPIQIVRTLEASHFTGKFITFGSYFEIGSSSNFKYFKEEELAYSSFKVSNDYCISKRQLTRFCFESEFKILHYHIILPSLYGVNENQNRLIPYLVAGLKFNKKIELSSGSQVRQFLHVRDVVDFINIVITNEINEGVYNLSSEESIQVREIVKIISEFFKIDGDQYLGKSVKNDENMLVLLLDDSKARALNWQPKVSLHQGLKEYL